MDRRSFLKQTLAASAVGPALFSRGASAQAPGPVPPDQSNRPSPPSRIRVWIERPAPAALYPEGIEGAIAAALQPHPECQLSISRLSDPDHGLADSLLDQTDVLIWWGRLHHDDVADARAQAVADRVRGGKLGLIALHASFASKPFRLLMGRPCEPKSWGDEGKAEHVEIKDPKHPIARGLEPFVIPRASTFSEPFTVPEPESVVLTSSWETGEHFRSGMTWSIEQGRVVYLRPGDDQFPVLFHPAVRQVVANAALWAARQT
jgi:trehalose utilization protein